MNWKPLEENFEMSGDDLKMMEDDQKIVANDLGMMADDLENHWKRIWKWYEMI